jgi:hypothetical protein
MLISADTRAAVHRSAAHDALLHYVFKKGIYDAVSIETNLDRHIVNLLTDIRYLCHHRSIEFTAAVIASEASFRQSCSD